MTPFLPEGTLGVLQAMGFTFIALQGFDLIAAVGGRIRDPSRTIPRAMLLSLGAALAIYLPLLFVLATVGADGESIQSMSQADPETVLATAVRNYMGPVGYWLVVVAAILSTLSALNANLLAASHVALSMAHDRTLPSVLEGTHPRHGTPMVATYASTLTLLAILFMVPDLAAAGAAASLIFLVSFALAQWMAILARRRTATKIPFRTPWFPVIPVVGGAACIGMALFQGIAVPSAGGIAMMWLGLGVLLYMSVFANRARLVDAFAEGRDPHLSRLRGRNPLVLVPIANPAAAGAMTAMGHALAAPGVGRVLLLSVVRSPAEREAQALTTAVSSAQDVLRESLTASLMRGHAPEVLMTVSPNQWSEITRVAGIHRCESLLVGLSRLEGGERELENLLNTIDCDVTVLRAPTDWLLQDARRVLVPVGRRLLGNQLRARMLGSLSRDGSLSVTFMRVLPTSATAQQERDIRGRLERLAADEMPRTAMTEIIRSDDRVAATVERAAACDLMILGLQRHEGRRLFGEVAIRIAGASTCAIAMISRKE
jgi:hypothetical protein